LQKIIAGFARKSKGQICRGQTFPKSDKIRGGLQNLPSREAGAGGARQPAAMRV